MQNGPPEGTEVPDLDPAPQIYAPGVNSEDISEIAKRALGTVGASHRRAPQRPGWRRGNVCGVGPISMPEAARPYETVGYVIGGRAELRLEGETIPLAAGDSWTVPKGASHTYVILEPFTAVEATSPPAEVQGRDEP